MCVCVCVCRIGAIRHDVDGSLSASAGVDVCGGMRAKNALCKAVLSAAEQLQVMQVTSDAPLNIMLQLTQRRRDTAGPS